MLKSNKCNYITTTCYYIFWGNELLKIMEKENAGSIDTIDYSNITSNADEQKR